MTFKFDENKAIISYVAAYRYTMQAAEEAGIPPAPDSTAIFKKASLTKLEADWLRFVETNDVVSGTIDLPGVDILRMVRFVGYELKRLITALDMDDAPIERLDYYPDGLYRMYLMDILEEDTKLMGRIYRTLKPLPQS